MTRDPEVDALRQRRITNAAAALFAAHGFDAVTVDQIAAAAPCSKRTLYARFASKEAIRLAIVAEEFDQFAEFAAAAAAKEQGARQTGDEILGWLAERHRAEPYRAGAALAFSLEPGDADLLDARGAGGRAGDERRALLARIIAAGDTLEAAVAELIARGQRDGTLRPELDAAVTGMALWASISALVQMAASKSVYVESRYGLGQDQFLAAGMDLIWNGLGARPDPAANDPKPARRSRPETEEARQWPAS
ncbi:MAG: TetR/AcrR family transcriptional regulator [Bifidobacteriaceae bacterium]|nr:TetR/AcrR family transcriptional regulator [Bifidobacteriaceae bacterium]